MSAWSGRARVEVRDPEVLDGIHVRTLRDGEESAWDNFVRSHTDGSFFHLHSWGRVIETCFGFRRFSLAAFSGRDLVGVLPLFESRSLLSGHALISVPFAIRGGVLAVSQSAANRLLASAKQLAEELHVEYLELRSERACSADLPTKDVYVTFKADLSLPEDALLKRMDRKRRQMLNFAARAGYSFRFAGLDGLPSFHKLFAKSMRSHGTPVHSRRFLSEIMRRHPNEVNLGFVYKGEQLLAGTLNLISGSTFMPFYAGVDREHRQRAVDEFMYWSLIQWAKAEGLRTFDFGRSRKGTGAYKFKVRWGMDEVPLKYQYYLAGGKEMPNVSPANRRYEILIAAWRRLPLPMTHFLGPYIARRIP